MKKTYRREPFWYKDAIIYELNIKGFYDSNGDGIGDFAGLEKKLDYLEDLGVTAIWLLPFYPSPLRDDGYDIQDYYNVADRYGNLDDFKRFLDAAHDRGLQVITELVINHTSDKHDWFERARRAPIGSPERDYYVWSDSDKKWPDVRIIFTDTETSNWTWDPVAKQYYWHRFFSHQPDLNFDSPDVQREIIEVLDYWMNMGIDGFRLDAIPYLFEREGTNGENLPETHEYLKKLRTHVDENYDNVLFLAEANMWPEDSASYFGDDDECHMNYHFPLMPRMYMSVKLEDRYPITDIFDQTPEIPPNCQWATFLRNHDELTLEMVTEEERDFMNNVYAEDPKARINVGIRRRLAPLMDNDQDKIKLMNVLLMSLPGTPVLYYGDEIGMGDNIYLKDRDGVRTPMQWDNNLNAGFSEADPHSLYMPVIQNTEYSYQWVNVKRQEANPNSLLNWTKELLANRKAHKVFGRGSLKFLDPENPHLLVFLRKFEQETILVVINLSRHAQATELELADFAGAQPREIFGGSTFPQVGEGPYPITIGPLSYYWLQLETDRHLGVDYRNLSSSSLNVISLNDLLTRNNQKKLSTSVLPPYLENVGWMGEHRTNIESVKVLNFQLTSIGEETFGWLLMKLTYRKGSPETVQLPVAFAPFDGESQDKEEVISLVDIGGEMMVMYDALYNANYRASVVEGKSFDADVAAFRLQANEEMQSAEKSTVNIRHSGTEYALLQSPGLNVKFYRRLGVEPSPDLETKSLLTAKDFAASPKVLGSLHYKPNGKMNATLAIFERRLGEDTTGAGYVHNELRTFASDLVQKLEQTADLEANISDLVDGNFVGKIQELGQIIATFHQLVNGEKATPNFSTEAMSLHYQRSVYAGLKGDVRETITLLKKHFPQLDVDAAGLAEAIIAQEGNIHTKLKRIYDHKLESDKIRIHGDFTLEQVALSGGKFLIKNFDGDPDLPFSQRRLRRSPAKDLANLMRSISYASGLVLEEQSSDLDNDVADRLEIWLRQASDHLSSALVSAYQEETAGSRLLPADETDLTVLLDAFRIEKSLQELRYDLRYRIGQVKIPLRGLLGLLE